MDVLDIACKKKANYSLSGCLGVGVTKFLGGLSGDFSAFFRNPLQKHQKISHSKIKRNVKHYGFKLIKCQPS